MPGMPMGGMPGMGNFNGMGIPNNMPNFNAMGMTNLNGFNPNGYNGNINNGMVAAFNAAMNSMNNSNQNKK